MKIEDMARLAEILLPLAQLNKRVMYAKGDIKRAVECEQDICVFEEAIRRVADKKSSKARKGKRS
ncbi:MAG TPA: hypothetical protein PKD55_02630 [Bellilinea sp.]|nr:hypothetical protein [Bellilinea sp.]